MKNKKFNPKRKNRIKIIRSILEGITLFIIMVVIIKAIFTFSIYEHYTSAQAIEDEKGGFIAVSYFGVDRTGDDTLISTEALEKQIKALKDNGYSTITQQDVLDYYFKGKVLPKKALFLLFEDGRRDTAIFSQKILEKYNYKATMLTYADKFEKNDPKFLMPKDILKLQKSSYWELGTNGYRLEYINVYDKDSDYIGKLSSIEFSGLSSKINREYNHYLMDYMRDEYGVPTETYEEMKNRINSDYINLSKIYNKELGNIPTLYALMHSNTGQFGTNDKASEINGKWIKELFSMNFNREGYSLNLSNSSIYDLTRIQPQAYWSTNHLLMRIWDDTKSDMKFVLGDKDKASKFQELKGRTEFIDDKIVITSLPKEKGLIKLLDSENYKNIKVEATLTGNIIGSQAIYLRASENLNSSICMQLINNTVNIIENQNGAKSTIYSVNLDEEKNKNRQYDIKEAGKRKVELILIDENLTVSIDGINIIEELKVGKVTEGSILLESAWGEYGYSQRNIADDVYDGVFKGLRVTNIDDKILFDSSLKGREAIKYIANNFFNKLVNWFIKHL